MRRNHNIVGKCLLSTGLVLSLAALSGAANAGNFEVLQKFKPAEGASSFAGLYEDAKGNLFGTTLIKGADKNGTAFELTPYGTGYKYILLHTFTGGEDGGEPDGNFIADSSGTLWSTTSGGGLYGAGNVFSMDPSTGAETVIYSFTGGADGGNPYSALVADASGNMYGTTYDGGAYGYGTVFEVTPGGTETVLHSFAGGTDGAYPIARVMLYNGLIYGTTDAGGGGTACDGGCGTVFSLDPANNTWTETVLHSFTGGSDGAGPEGGLVVHNGNIYSTAFGGGIAGCYGGFNCGTVWEMAPDGSGFNVVHSFTGGSDGSNPDNGVIFDAKGNMYGIPERGANIGCYQAAGCGIVFKLSPDGTFSVLHTFAGEQDGGNVLGEPIEDQVGDILDVAAEGGYPRDCFRLLGCGTVFKVKE
jgi:uncharacterized repeat protein (TIGR03803 family)